MDDPNLEDRPADDDEQTQRAVAGPPRRGPARWPVYLLLLAMILVPAIFWRQVWWGAPLSDDQISERLRHSENVRQVQHALEQLSQRMQRDPESARPFYPQVVALAGHPEPMLRSAAAWLMGEDNRHEPFHQKLTHLLSDAQPLVRYNAATSLTRFGDGTGRRVLREMLMPHKVTAGRSGQPAGGTVMDVLRQGDSVRLLTQIVLLDVGGGEEAKILAPLEGRLARLSVTRGTRVAPGDEIAEIAPNALQVEAALRALYLVGHPEDLHLIESYSEPAAGSSDRVAQQARATAAAVRQRAETGQDDAAGALRERADSSGSAAPDRLE